MVPLQGGAGVERGQGVLHLLLERVVRPSVVQVVTNAGDHQTKSLNLKRERRSYDKVNQRKGGKVKYLCLC